MKRAACHPTEGSFLDALLKRGVPENVARACLRDARAAVRHGPSSMSVTRLCRVLVPFGLVSIDLDREREALCFGPHEKRLPIPKE